MGYIGTIREQLALYVCLFVNGPDYKVHAAGVTLRR